MTTSNHKFIIQAGVDGIPQVKALGASIDDLTERTNRWVKDSTRSFDNIVSAFAKITAAAYSVGKAWDLMNLAARAKQEEQAAANLAASYGSNINKIVADLKRASVNTIDTMTLVRSAGTQMMLGIKPDELTKLMEFARGTARQTGKDVSEAFDKIGLAVARQSDKILDDLGIKISATKANEDYAVAIRKSVEQLTEADRRQAFLNATIKAGEELMARMGKQAKSTAEMFQSFEALWSNVKVWVGDVLTWLAKWATILFSTVGTAINKTVQWVAEGVVAVFSVLNKLPFVDFKDIEAGARAVAENSAMAVKSSVDFVNELIDMTDEATPTVGKFGTTMEQTGAQAVDMSKDLDKARDAVARLAKEIQEANTFKGMWGGRDRGAIMDLFFGEHDAAIAVSQGLQEIEEVAQKKIELDQREHDVALMLLQEEQRAELEANEQKLRDTEHFLDRVQDLFADTFEAIRQDGIHSFADILNSGLSLVAGTWSNQMAQAFRTNVFDKISKGGSADWSGLMYSLLPTNPLSGAGMGSWGYQTIGGMVGLPQGGYSGVGSAIGAGLGTMILPGWGTAAGALLGGLGGSLFGGNGKNLQWGLGSGSGLDSAGTVNTAFGRVGAWDKHESIDSAGMRPYLEKVAEVTYKLAEGVQQSVIDQITGQMSSWTGGASAKVTAEGLSNKSLDYLKQITGQLDGWLADLIDGWTGSFDELYTYLTARDATLAAMQQEIDALIRPVTGLDAINQQFDMMAETAADLHAEQSLLDDIEQARLLSIREFIDAQREATQAEQERSAAMLSSIKDWQISLMPSDQQQSEQWSRISGRYNIRSLNPPTADQAQEWVNAIAAMPTQQLANWATANGYDMNQVQADVEWLADLAQSGVAATDAAWSMRESIAGLLTPLNRMGNGAEAAADAFNDMTSALSSIDDLILRLTGGDLAPVQSAEFFNNQYAQLIASARTDPANVGAFTAFVPQLLDFMQGYGMDYGELSGGILSDVQNLRDTLEASQNDIHVHVEVDGREIGYVVAEQMTRNPDLVSAIFGLLASRRSA